MIQVEAMWRRFSLGFMNQAGFFYFSFPCEISLRTIEPQKLQWLFQHCVYDSMVLRLISNAFGEPSL